VTRPGSADTFTSDTPTSDQRVTVAMTRRLTPHDFLSEMHRRGATRLERVAFRRNRSRIWSLTRRATALNVHEVFGSAPVHVLDAFAVIARRRGIADEASRRAGQTIRSWPELELEMRRIQAERGRRGRRAPECCATEEQHAYLREVYVFLNETRFDGLLPDDIPLRLSNRMRSALGTMRPGLRPDGSRYVVEIALNVDLMLPDNGPERVDTLLHEMAHAADYRAGAITDRAGGRGHAARAADRTRSTTVRSGAGRGTSAR